MNELLLPENLNSIVINDKYYQTVLHYVYVNVLCGDLLTDEKKITKNLKSKGQIEVREFISRTPLHKLRTYFYRALEVCESKLQHAADAEFPFVYPATKRLETYLKNTFKSLLFIAYDKIFKGKSDLKDILLNITSKNIVYDNVDVYLGIGKHSDGFNIVGKTLQQFREQFHKENTSLSLKIDDKIKSFLIQWERDKIKEIMWSISCFYAFILMKNNKKILNLNVSMVKYVVEGIYGVSTYLQNSTEISNSFKLDLIEGLIDGMTNQYFPIVQQKWGDYISDEVFIYLWDYIYTLKVNLLEKRNISGRYLQKITNLDQEINKLKFLNELHLFGQLKDLKFIPKLTDFWICQNQGNIILKDIGFNKLTDVIKSMDIKEDQWKSKLDKIVKKLEKNKIQYLGDDIVSTIYYTIDSKPNTIKDLYIVNLSEYGVIE